MNPISENSIGIQRVIAVKIIFILALMLMLLLFPERSAQAAMNALEIWGLSVVPSLFPYMVLCQSLSSLLAENARLLLLLSPALGLLGGSPSGSASLSAAFKIKPMPQARIMALCALCGTISPMFFLGPVSAWLGSAQDGARLLAAHLCGAVLTCLACILVLKTRKTTQAAMPIQSVAAAGPIARSVDAVLNVGGCIVFYSVAASCIGLVFPFLGENAHAILHALLEVSGGLKALTVAPLPRKAMLILCAAVSGFSGFSILTQNLFFLRPFGIRMKHLVLLGMLRAACCALAMAFLL